MARDELSLLGGLTCFKRSGFLRKTPRTVIPMAVLPEEPAFSWTFRESGLLASLERQKVEFFPTPGVYRKSKGKEIKRI